METLQLLRRRTLPVIPAVRGAVLKAALAVRERVREKRRRVKSQKSRSHQSPPPLSGGVVGGRVSMLMSMPLPPPPQPRWSARVEREPALEEPQRPLSG